MLGGAARPLRARCGMLGGARVMNTAERLGIQAGGSRAVDSLPLPHQPYEIVAGAVVIFFAL
jgi:hypothetical protein